MKHASKYKLKRPYGTGSPSGFHLTKFIGKHLDHEGLKLKLELYVFKGNVYNMKVDV